MLISFRPILAELSSQPHLYPAQIHLLEKRQPRLETKTMCARFLFRQPMPHKEVCTLVALMQGPAKHHQCLTIFYGLLHSCMAMLSNLSNEYCSIVRLAPDRPAPSGFTSVSSTAPALFQQLCRTFTFARGLTLYEVWDDWNQTATGHLVPSPVAALASEYKHGFSPDRWSSLPLHQRNRLKHARTLVLERFPRMPDIAIIRIAERAQREQWNGDKKKLEERVVNHVRHEWTSYETQLEHYVRYPQFTGLPNRDRTAAAESQRGIKLSRKKDEVLEMVIPRMRDVLLSWLPNYISSLELTSFWRRHHLFDAVYGHGEYREKSILVQTSSLHCYGGLEAPANLLSKTELII